MMIKTEHRGWLIESRSYQAKRHSLASQSARESAPQRKNLHARRARVAQPDVQDRGGG
jgi:hypothetical protein